MIGEIYTTAVQGTHCGAPFSVSLAYEQIQPTDNNGLDLVTAFWAATGPGAQWLTLASDKLKALCMSWSSPTDVGAALLEDKVGEKTEQALPPVVAWMFHLRPLTPYFGVSQSKPKFDVGRFFLPGICSDQVNEFMLKQSTLADLREFGARALTLDVATVTSFRLVPFPKWVQPQDGDNGVRSCQPDALLRRIKTRKPNACELFAGAGQAGGRPVI